MAVAILTAANAVWGYCDWEDGDLLDVNEIDIEKMKKANLNGADAVLMVMEQFVTDSYGYIYISPNYLLRDDQKEYVEISKERIAVGVARFLKMNNLIYANVIYDQYFFILVLAKRYFDMKPLDGIAFERMEYSRRGEKRKNVVEKINSNNIVKLKI
jgi:hypothetical protein